MSVERVDLWLQIFNGVCQALWLTVEKLCVDGEWLQHRHAYRLVLCLSAWSLHYFHNHLSCFDTLLSFRIVVVLVGDLCVLFVLQLFTKQHFIALFFNLSSSVLHLSPSFSLSCLLPTGEMNPWADLTPGMPPSSTRATQKPKTSPHPHQSGKQEMMQGNLRDRK